AWTPIAAGDQVELAELAEPAAGDESVDVTEGRHEAEVLRDHQDPARGVGHADHPVDLGKAGRDRLLHEDVQARLECRERGAQGPRRGGSRARGAVIGVGVTKCGKHARTSAELFAEAAADALLDAELPVSAVQALYYGNVVGSETEHQFHTGPQAASILGIPTIPTTRFEAACASSHAAFRHAVMEIAAGVSDVVLVGGAERVLNVPT